MMTIIIGVWIINLKAHKKEYPIFLEKVFVCLGVRAQVSSIGSASLYFCHSYLIRVSISVTTLSLSPAQPEPPDNTHIIILSEYCTTSEWSWHRNIPIHPLIQAPPSLSLSLSLFPLSCTLTLFYWFLQRQRGWQMHSLLYLSVCRTDQIIFFHQLHMAAAGVRPAHIVRMLVALMRVQMHVEEPLLVQDAEKTGRAEG